MSFNALNPLRGMLSGRSQLGWLVAVFGGMVLLILGLTARLVEVTWLASNSN